MIKTVVKNFFGIRQLPSFVTYFPTWRCNSRCIMCDIWKKKAGYELSIGEIENIFSQLKKLSVVRISGGEPFMRDDIHNIVNTIDEVSSPKILHITTNGLMPDRIVDAVKNMHPAKRLHIKISVDSIGKSNDRIRGVPGAYEKSLETVMKLSDLRKEKGFYLGVNQTVVDKESMDAYFKLSKIIAEYDVMIHPVFAYSNDTALYSSENKSCLPGFETFGNFSKQEIEKFIKKLIKRTGGFTSFKERIIKKYYLKGLYNRVMKNKKKPNPPCLALKSHLRILPNGDVPVCLYNSSVIGNLREQKLKDLWYAERAEKMRKWVGECPGCWAGCETIVSAVYSGDIIKGL